MTKDQTPLASIVREEMQHFLPHGPPASLDAGNAAELLVSDKTFLSDARDLLEGMGGQYAGVLPDEFNPREYRVVVGLIRKEAGDIPFFSRLTLMRAAERVAGKALRVAFVVIPVQ